MANWGSCEFNQLKELQKKLEVLQKSDLQRFCALVAKELTARLLRKTIQRTPVGVYPAETGKVGGTLRRGWTGEKNTDVISYANALPITKEGNTFTITIINPVHYASYVEYGHRTRGGGGWVDGKFMLTKSEIEIESQAPKIIEKKLLTFLKGVFDE